jgi:hypothetical protein
MTTVLKYQDKLVVPASSPSGNKRKKMVLVLLVTCVKIKLSKVPGDRLGIRGDRGQ